MLYVKLVLKNYITKELLFYAWLDLKSKQKYFFYYFDPYFSEPLSLSWFSITSILLKKGSYKFLGSIVLFKKNNFSRKNVLGLEKTKILEKTFLFLLALYFSKNIFLQNINLTECLRLFFKQYIYINLYQFILTKV